MKKLLRLLFRLLLFVVVIILGFVVLNVLRFSSRQVEVQPIKVFEPDQESLHRLSEAIQIPTISYQDRVDTLAFQTWMNYLDSLYGDLHEEMDFYPVNQFSRVYRWPGKNAKLEPILLLAHSDVVPVEEKSRSRWLEDPFGGIIKEDYVWGRGSLDDKMNLLGILEAIKILIDEGYQPERTLFLAFGHDEEVGGTNGAQAIARRFAEQGLEFAYILDEGMVVMDKALPGLKNPVSLIGIAEKGYTTLSLRVELEQGGHSSMPPSETAIGILSKAIYQLETHPFPAEIEGITGKLFDYAGPEMNLLYKTIFANRWLFGGILKKQLSLTPGPNATIRTTIAPTIINAGVKDNVLPAKAEAQINFRILPGQTVNSVMDYVRDIIDDQRVEVSVEEHNQAFSVDPSKVSGTDSFGFTVLQKTAREVFPEAIVAPALMIGGTDSRHYQSLSDNIFRFSPVQLQQSDLARIHGFNERISISNYHRLIRFYHQLILNSCN